jgi:hypothetical protein
MQTFFQVPKSDTQTYMTATELARVTLLSQTNQINQNNRKYKTMKLAIFCFACTIRSQ